MGDFFDDDSVFRAFNDRTLNVERNASGYGLVLLLVAGIYTCLKALEFLGYPVRWWLHMAIDRAKACGLSGGSFSVAAPVDDDTTMQNGGNVLSRALGLNGASLLQKGVRGVAGALSKGPGGLPPGLGNWDNSCYQNSIIQGMASLPSLRAYLANTTTEYSHLNVESTNGALFDMVKKLNDPRNHGQNFWVRGKLKSMSTFQQQDAQEYYSKILDALEKEVQQEVKKRTPSDSWADAAKVLGNSEKNTGEARSGNNTSRSAVDDGIISDPPKAISNPLDGLLAQRVGCIRCGYVEGLQLIPFNCVTVSIGRNGSYDIRECLDDYTNLERIEGVECAKCTLLKNKTALVPLADRAPAYAERLQAVEAALENDDFDDKTLVKNFKILKKNWTQSTKTRQAVIARAPKALVLHVNRSIFDEMTGAMYKNPANVSYPRVLDLGNWCLGSDLAGGVWPRDPTKSMLGDLNAEPVTDSPYQYRLRAAVTHYGGHSNGHYVCYRPHAKPSSLAAGTASDEDESTREQWWRFSDDSVYAIPEEQAHQGNIFMLFYERIEGNTPARNDAKEVEGHSIAIEKDIPLPPESVLLHRLSDDIAASIPLPDDDDWLEDQPNQPLGGDSLPTPGVAARHHEAIDSVENPVVPLKGTKELDSEVATSAEAVDTATPAAGSPMSHSEDCQVQVKTAPNDFVPYPTPPPESPSVTTFTDIESAKPIKDEEAPSTQSNSDEDGALTTKKSHHKLPRSPHLMRTAGESASRNGGSRASLPMVTAT